MIQIRPSDERGHNKLSWLDTRFTFSFDQYYDPEHMHCLLYTSSQNFDTTRAKPDSGWSGRELRPRDLLLLLVSLYAGLCAIRMMPLFVLIAVPRCV